MLNYIIFLQYFLFKIILSKYFLRTDSSIKNYYYSLLRKNLRFLIKKIKCDYDLKNISFNETMEEFLQKLEINFIYKLIKKNNLKYKDLCLKSLIDLISDSNQKISKNKEISIFETNININNREISKL